LGLIIGNKKDGKVFAHLEWGFFMTAMFEYYWDLFTTWLMHVGMPLVGVYHMITGSVFLNTAAEDAEGLEKLANVLLIPTQYLLSGQKAIRVPSKQTTLFVSSSGYDYQFEQRFSYNDSVWMGAKTAASLMVLPFSLTAGVILKGLAMSSEETRKHHHKLEHAFNYPELVKDHSAEYKKLGLSLVNIQNAEWIDQPKFLRRPGDEKNMHLEKEALREIVSLFTSYKIPFWLDCGTCLGAQRYGGVIPWDFDVDLAILQIDFDNARKVLKKLDPSKYSIQDWSSRDRPKSYLKVYLKETGALIDIYHFAIDSKNRMISSVLSNENSVFLSQGWKIRERRFVVPTPFEWVFPLKKVNFDGIVCFVPNNIENYLKQRYGENIGPAKIFNPLTDRYEKDPLHPYWQQPHAH
jgi:hypothetical protein